MLINDLIDVVFIDIGIPGFIGINNDHRTFVTAIKATGIIDTDFLFAVQL